MQLANAFNKYFANIGNIVCIEEIIPILKNIRTNAAGTDNISKTIIKDKFHIIARQLLPIINYSFLEGIVPIELKPAKVIPYYKAGDKDVLGNYRPVAVLPLFSKVVEKLFYDRLLHFLNKNNILYTYQYGFRKKTLYGVCYNGTSKLYKLTI